MTATPASRQSASPFCVIPRLQHSRYGQSRRQINQISIVLKTVKFVLFVISFKNISYLKA
jgi:hypothetical protein